MRKRSIRIAVSIECDGVTAADVAAFEAYDPRGDFRHWVEMRPPERLKWFAHMMELAQHEIQLAANHSELAAKRKTP